MSKEQGSHLPAATASDAAYAIVKGTLSAIPIAGGFATELFGLMIAPPLTKRRDEWFESLAQRLKTLQLDFERLGQNPVFVTTVMHATQVALRTHQEEKLDALRNAVVNSAVGNTPEEDLRSLFLNLIDEFTPTHIHILNLIRNGASTNLPLFRELIDRRELTDQMVLGLARSGLLKDTRPYAARGRDTGESLLEFVWKLSNLGDQFLRFISSRP
jgi:hypothetical protein